MSPVLRARCRREAARIREPSTTQRRHIVCGSRPTGGDDGANAAASAGAGETVMERLCHPADPPAVLAVRHRVAPPRPPISTRRSRSSWAGAGAAAAWRRCAPRVEDLKPPMYYHHKDGEAARRSGGRDRPVAAGAAAVAASSAGGGALGSGLYHGRRGPPLAPREGRGDCMADGGGGGGTLAVRPPRFREGDGPRVQEQ